MEFGLLVCTGAILPCGVVGRLVSACCGFRFGTARLLLLTSLVISDTEENTMSCLCSLDGITFRTSCDALGRCFVLISLVLRLLR